VTIGGDGQHLRPYPTAHAPFDSSAQSIPDEITKLFEYSRSGPLDIQERSAEKHEGVTIHDITYASPVKGLVTAYLAVPAGRGPFAGVLFQHWGFGDRAEFLPEMLLLAKAGAVSISIDAPWARPEPWKTEDEGGHITHPEIDRDIYVQTVIDLRRALDLLLSRHDVDAKRIGFVGHSYGATWGGVLAGVERRIATYVLMAGLPDVADFSPSGAPAMDSISEQMKAKFNEQQLQHYADIISAIAPVRFVAHSSPASVFMQFAVKDTFISRSAAARYYEAAGDPKRCKWYFASHELNDPAALADRVQWLQEKLRLRPRASSPSAMELGHTSSESAARLGQSISSTQCHPQCLTSLWLFALSTYACQRANNQALAHVRSSSPWLMCGRQRACFLFRARSVHQNSAQ
jgi:cephalosporin-C deacetylase-like acetyl esterase